MSPHNAFLACRLPPHPTSTPDEPRRAHSVDIFPLTSLTLHRPFKAKPKPLPLAPFLQALLRFGKLGVFW